MSIRAIAYRWIAIVVCSMVVVGISGTSSQASTTTPQCTTTNLSLGFGNRISAMTGEMGGIHTLTNNGKFACYLYGYPGISLYDSKGRVLPFTYTRSSSHYMSHAAPNMVVLRPGARSYFFVAKYRCDIGDAMEAATIRVYPPNTRKQLIGRASADTVMSVGTLSYCKGGAKDPGQVVDVSPVRATDHYL